MTRLAQNRDTHLTAAEIASQALVQFDAGPSVPSIRQLAAALQVAPSAIYHHYPTRAAIFQAAVELVWEEANTEAYELIPDPLTMDPAEVLVVAGVVTRRAFFRHHRVAPFMAATPESNEFMTNTLALMGNLFERLGVAGEDAGAAFHTYATFILGSVLFAAARRTANEQLEPAEVGFHSLRDLADAPPASEATRASLDEVMDMSRADPVRDEELFTLGLRRLIASFT